MTVQRESVLLSLGFAPQFSEGLRLLQRLLIHHTSCSPGSDALQRPPRSHVWIRAQPFVLASRSQLPLLRLREWQGYQQRLWQDGHVFIHAPHSALFTRVCLSLTAERKRLSPPGVFDASLTCSSLSDDFFFSSHKC